MYWEWVNTVLVIPAVEFASFRLQQEYKRLIDTDLIAIHTAVLSYSENKHIWHNFKF